MRLDLRNLVVEHDLDGVAELATTSRRVLGKLLSLTYDADPAVAWGAVEAMGAAASRLTDEDPDFVRHHLRRLHWLLQEESGGICWYSPQAMAEIVARRPEAFADYIPIVVNLLMETAEEDLEHFRPGMIWAVGRLGAWARPAMSDVLPSVVAALDHPDALVRAAAVWCLGRTGHVEELEARPALLEDEAPSALFHDGALHAVTVAAVAREALRADSAGTLPDDEPRT